MGWIGLIPYHAINNAHSLISDAKHAQFLPNPPCKDKWEKFKSLQKLYSLEILKLILISLHLSGLSCSLLFRLVIHCDGEVLNVTDHSYCTTCRNCCVIKIFPCAYIRKFIGHLSSIKIARVQVSRLDVLLKRV